ncbi:MAG: hypothetical protein ACREQL_08220, partial [Candidatus Binatia bacterium]
GQADVLVAGGMDATHETLGRWIADGGGAREPVREGAVLLVLERRDHAACRGARPLGLVGHCSAGFDPQTEGGVAAPAMPFDLAAALEGLGPSKIVVTGRCPTGHLASVELQPVPSVADRQHRGCEEQQHGYAHDIDGDGHGK